MLNTYEQMPKIGELWYKIENLVKYTHVRNPELDGAVSCRDETKTRRLVQSIIPNNHLTPIIMQTLDNIVNHPSLLKI